jgi:hypothetical protein
MIASAGWNEITFNKGGRKHIKEALEGADSEFDQILEGEGFAKSKVEVGWCR